MNAEGNDAGGQSSKSRDPRAYGRIPNEVVLDRQLSDKALGLLSYRLTKTGDFSLSVDAAAIGLPLSDRSKGRKIGRSQCKRLIRELTQAGYLKRCQQPSHGRASFSYALESVHVPASGYDRICREWWHDGSLSVEAIAALLVIRAFNCPIGLDTLRKRFDWGKKRARDAIKELLAAGLIIQAPGARGTYRDAEVLAQEVDRRSDISATGDTPSDDKPSHDTPSDDEASHTRTDRSAHKDRKHAGERTPRKRYGFDAKASNPDPSQGSCAHGGRPGPTDPFATESLLGWARGDERGLASRVSFEELSRDTIAEVECVASDEVILDKLRASTAGRGRRQSR